MRVLGSENAVAGRALRADAQRNHRRILAAARAALEEAGAGVPLEDVARRAEVSVATVYRRFTGRQDLVRAVFEQYFTDEIEPLVHAAAAEPDPWVGLCRGLEQTVATVVENTALLQATRDAGVGPADVAGRFLEPLGEVLRRAQRAGRVRSDLRPEDLGALVVMAVAATASGAAAEATDLRDGWRRYLALMLDGSRAAPELPALPGGPPPH